MHSRLSSSCAFVFHRSGLRWGLHLLCLLLTSPRYSAPIARHPASLLRSTGEISRGKTRYLPCIDAGFTKCTPTTADGGLRSHVPARPRCITPHIRFLFIVPQFRIGLPSDPASRRRPRLEAPTFGALLLAFGSAKTWQSDFHRLSNAPCPAHTLW